MAADAAGNGGVELFFEVRTGPIDRIQRGQVMVGKTGEHRPVFNHAGGFFGRQDFFDGFRVRFGGVLRFDPGSEFFGKSHHLSHGKGQFAIAVGIFRGRITGRFFLLAAAGDDQRYGYGHQGQVYRKFFHTAVN